MADEPMLQPGEWHQVEAPAGAPTFAGHNRISINSSTMQQIVQFWLSHKWAGDTPNVTEVAWNAGQNWFDITLKDVDDA